MCLSGNVFQRWCARWKPVRYGNLSVMETNLLYQTPMWDLCVSPRTQPASTVTPYNAYEQKKNLPRDYFFALGATKKNF